MVLDRGYGVDGTLGNWFYCLHERIRKLESLVVTGYFERHYCLYRHGILLRSNRCTSMTCVPHFYDTDLLS